jgi:hypothetical protein
MKLDIQSFENMSTYLILNNFTVDELEADMCSVIRYIEKLNKTIHIDIDPENDIPTQNFLTNFALFAKKYGNFLSNISTLVTFDEN